MMFLHDQSHQKTEIIYEAKHQDGYGAGDTFRWIFNFAKGFWSFFHGNNSVLRQKLSAESIVPGITLGNRGECVGVVSWKFQ